MHEPGKEARPSLFADDVGMDDVRCADALRRGSRSFNAAALLLPGRVRQPARAVYAFCRAGDDLVDGTADPLAAVAVLGRRLDAIYGGSPRDYPEDRAFARVVHVHSIPRTIPQAMLEGFLWDAQNRRYDTGSDLLAYAARVAGTVGVMMAILMGVRSRAAFARACELGFAMQLTNIARDVGEDARNGRVYLPTRWLADEGLTTGGLLTSPQPSEPLARVVRRVLEAADRYYRSGMTGLAGLPVDCRVAICAAGLTYRSIGTRIAANGYDSVSQRAVTPASTKVAMLAAALPSLARMGNVPDAAPVKQVAFLVDAAHESRRPVPVGLNAKIERFIELLQRSGRGSAPMAQTGEWSVP